MSWPWAVCALAAFVLSWLLTAAVRRYALARGLVDQPGARRSHHNPTPRGGGLAIAVATLAALAAVCALGALPVNVFAAWAGAGALAGAAGFWDDHGHVAPALRLPIQAVAAVWGLWWLGGMPPLPWAGAFVDPGIWGDVLAVVGLLWLINLYNFMDGIDAIAALETLAVCAGGVLLALLAARPGLFVDPLLLGAATAGFLCWNWPPAKIFLGDVGSGFIGIGLGLIALRAGAAEPQLLWGWLILLAVFVSDSSVTLLRRLARRENIFSAHRSHAYQRLSRRLGSHLPVSAGAALITLLWLLPLAALLVQGLLAPWLAIVLAYGPLLILAPALGAGEEEPIIHSKAEAHDGR